MLRFQRKKELKKPITIAPRKLRIKVFQQLLYADVFACILAYIKIGY